MTSFVTGARGEAGRAAGRLVKRDLMRVAGVPVAVTAVRALRRSGLRAGVAVVYHGIGDPPVDPDAELLPVVGAALLESQLRHLADHYRPVGAAELPQAVAERRAGDPFPVAVTFDDDLRSHAREALPALRRAGVPGTFFLCGASLEEPFSFWWERLQRAYDSGVAFDPPPSSADGDIRSVATAVEDMPRSDRDAFAERLGAMVGPDPPESGMRAREIAALRDGGQEIGFHTRGHDPLTGLDDERLASALAEGREEVAAAAGTPLDTIAYPHGRADIRVAGAARTAGFRLGFTTTRCAVTPDDDPLLLSRIDVPVDSTGRLALRLARALVLAALGREYSPRP